MWVVKIGGSLQNNKELKGWLKVVTEEGAGRIVLVPGGGRFADAVRDAQTHWRFDDKIAHRMAILAMQQFGLMLTGLNSKLHATRSLDTIAELHRQRKVCVWLPEVSMLDFCGIPETWGITSDSLAAWLCKTLRADHLALVKSIAIESQWISVDNLTKQKFVDKDFADFVKYAGFSTQIYGPNQQLLFAERLIHDRNTGAAVTC